MARDEQDDDGDINRLDKWLWAARFFKTRNLARVAINGGKIHVNGDRAKPSKKLVEGMTVTVSIGESEREVIVRQITDRRGSAKDAVLLYEETQASIEKQQARADQRKYLSHAPQPEKRPDKKSRRELRKMKQNY